MAKFFSRVGYFFAYWVLRVWWAFRRPATHGIQIAVWSHGKILAVRNAHRLQLSLPGGYAREEEQPRVQAARELKEETGLIAQPYQLKLAHRATHLFESRTETIDVFEIEYDSKPKLAVDSGEVLQAKFYVPQDLLQKSLTPHLRDYLEYRLAMPASAVRSG